MYIVLEEGDSGRIGVFEPGLELYREKRVNYAASSIYL